MALNSAALNAAVGGITSKVTHIALVDGTGTELTGGSYARQPVTWAAAANGVQRPSADLTFNVPAGTVGGWRGYSALTGGTNYDGGDLTDETYAAAGQYVLQASSTSYTVA
jgi:hypothetical protein